MSSELIGAVDPTGVVSSHRTMSTGKRNFDGLTGLRFFAAFGVVLYHFASIVALGWPTPMLNLVNSGYVAVSFFYVLSGFVLSYSYVNPAGEMQGSRRSFWVARFARIYPAYLLAFLLAAPTNIIWSMQVNQLGMAIKKLLVGAVSVLTLQQAWTPWSAWYWNFPAWSVSVEAFFYIGFPFLALSLRRFNIKKAIWGMILLWLVGMVPPLILWIMHGSAGPAPQNRLAMVVEFTPIIRLPEFLVGMLLGRAYVIGLRFSPAVNKAVSYASVVAVLLLLGFLPSIPRPLLANGLLVPLFALMIISFAEAPTLLARFLGWAPLVLLGEASYGIYILQIPVSYVLRTPPPLESGVTLFVYLLVLVVTALLSWRFVEAPLRIQIRRWFLKGKDAVARSQKDQQRLTQDGEAVAVKSS